MKSTFHKRVLFFFVLTIALSSVRFSPRTVLRALFSGDGGSSGSSYRGGYGGYGSHK